MSLASIRGDLNSERLQNVEKIIKKSKFDKQTQDNIREFLVNNHYNLKLFKQNKTKFKSLNGVFNKKIGGHEVKRFTSQLLGELYGLYDFSQETSLIEPYASERIENICRELKKDGYYIYENLLSPEICQSIIDQAQDLEFDTVDGQIIKGIQIDNPISNTHWIRTSSDLFQIKEINQIIFNPIFLSIAQSYLSTAPILHNANLWWSVPYSKNVENSQRFHQDFDDVSFLKLFIYLNDIETDNGPHCYVPQTHESRLPVSKKVGTRLLDEYVADNHSDQIVEFTSKKGTIVFEDTFGIHKGKIPESGYRIILQIEFCASTAIHHKGYFPMRVDYPDEFKEFSKKYPNILSRYPPNNI